MDKRIVITGVGVLSPIGIGKNEFWESAIEGKSGITENKFTYLPVKSSLMGLVKAFDCLSANQMKKDDKLGRSTLLALAGAEMAIMDSGLDLSGIDKTRIGLAIGTTMGEIAVVEKMIENEIYGISNHDSNKYNRCDSADMITILCDQLGLSGPSILIPAACAAGNYAIGVACDEIAAGRVDAMLAGGAEAFSKVLLIGFNRMKLAAQKYCQPFDKKKRINR